MSAYQWFLIAIALISSLILGCQTSGGEATAVTMGKAAAPISIQIEPDTEKLVPGDIIDFRITATSPVAVPQLELSVDVPDTLAVFSGDRDWRGPLAAGERQELVLAIRIPEQGGQRITATAVARFESGQAMAARDVYVLGQAQKRPEAAESRDTTHDGQTIREYQLP